MLLLDSDSDNSMKEKESIIIGMFTLTITDKIFIDYQFYLIDNRNDVEKGMTDQTNYLPKSRIILVSIYLSIKIIHFIHSIIYYFVSIGIFGM